MNAEEWISDVEAKVVAAHELPPKARYKSRRTIGSYIEHCFRTGTTDLSILRRCLAVLDESGDYCGIRSQILSRIGSESGVKYEVLASVQGDVDTRFYTVIVGDPLQLVGADLGAVGSRELSAATQDRLLAFREVPERYVSAELKRVAGNVPSLAPTESEHLVSATGPDLIAVTSGRIELAGSQCIDLGYEEYESLSLEVPPGTYSATICFYEFDSEEDDEWPDIEVRAIVAGPV